MRMEDVMLIILVNITPEYIDSLGTYEKICTLEGFVKKLNEYLRYTIIPFGSKICK